MPSSKQNSIDNIQYLSKSDIPDQSSKIIAEYRSLVEIIAMKYITSSFDKDDLVQEGMIGLLAAIKSFDKDKGASFKTYALVCVENSIQSAIRKTSRKKDVPGENVVPYEEKYIKDLGSAISAEDSYLANESVSTLADIIDKKLSPFENEVLRLHISGCNYDEIANSLGKNTKAIDNALQRIRKKLNSFF